MKRLIGLKRIEVVAALIREGDRFLICRRPADKARGLLWEFVGGKVERGETRERALVRECREELAITVEPRRIFTEVTHDYPDIKIHLTLFECGILRGQPQLLEHDDMRWITPAEISDYEFCPADGEILKLLTAENTKNKQEEIMFREVKKNFGFGCMRLPMNGDEVDYDEFNKMIDSFIANGFNYFDTAHGYLGGKSETALRDCLVRRYPRESYTLTNKLTNFCFKTEADVRPFFESQLKICGVDYFDFYLMHAQSRQNFDHFKRCRAYEQGLEFKKEGKIRHLGISFHDTAEVLDEILTQYPQVEVVQIQLNYVDFDDPAVQSKKCYEVCRKHNKPVIVMEPVKGGNLVNLPKEAQKYFDALGTASAASYAIRFAAGFDGIFMVLSGMSNLAQMNDNISFMKDFKPLNDEELKAVGNVCGVFKAMNLIACTACRYCTDGCPKKISIPDLFACMNTKNIYHDWNADYYYNEVHTKNRGKASECIKCGKCEKSCPQHLPIRDLLVSVAKEFEK